jgi:hypothetical protein
MMNKSKKGVLLSLIAVLLVVLGACTNNEETQPSNEETENANQESIEGMDHRNMDMSGSGEVPEGLKEAESPKYPVGSKAIIESDHMKGMKGAEATIVGAYDTTVYTVSYTPTTGGERVKDHKWVIHEELMDPGTEPLKPGAEVKTEAAHMEGMVGATFEINSAEQTTVYMVDFTTIDGEKVTNHKWVTESELSPVK